ncbi:hypothetical protein DPMN_103971 [Dreissena polymorpha]|uniref:Neuronal acetylcholine receptor subunit alpha-6 n=1 Tax=Dreissena polymorpha TaxID=45954 RepID=A0A9D4K2K0_DREPO|nr:hypothetical protein DPMN_103971 [Dreissena polymorpha]
MDMFTTIFAALILIGHAPTATCQTGANVRALRKKLFDDYDFRVRPTDNQSEPIEITVDLYLLAINELKESTETIKTTAFLVLLWNDSYLRWTPVDHANIEFAFWPQNEVWKPDLALKNSNLDYKELGVPSLNVYNHYTGAVGWAPFQVFESTCSMDIVYFPFDYQTCYLKFQAWSYSRFEVAMIGGSKGIELTQYEPNSGWDIIDSSWKVEEDSVDSIISFSLKLRRKPLPFMLSVIFPIITLAILNFCVFLLPADSGERASYAITVFLAFAVFLTIVSSSLPQNSDSIALIQIYLIIQTACSTLTTVLALALLRLNRFDKDVAIPRILVFVMRCFKCKCCSKGFDESSSGDAEYSNGPRVAKTQRSVAESRIFDGSPTFYVAYQNGSGMVQPHRGTTQKRMSDNSSTGDVEYSWREVVNFLDVVFFVMFACILVASSLGCFFKAALNAKP